MNPYRISPRQITAVDQAKSVLKWFDAEVATSVSDTAQAEEAFNATLDVLVQTHPDLVESLDSLSFAARILGNSEGRRSDIDRMRTEFIAALPYAIRLSLQNPT